MWKYWFFHSQIDFVYYPSIFTCLTLVRDSDVQHYESRTISSHNHIIYREKEDKTQTAPLYNDSKTYGGIGKHKTSD